MPTYRKKPVEVEAILLTEKNLREVAEWCGGYLTDDATWDYGAGAYKHPEIGYIFGAGFTERGIVIRTLEGDVFAKVERDYVIQGVQGEFYPCKRDIFVRTYEAVL